jgi:hypothetical protein
MPLHGLVLGKDHQFFALSAVGELSCSTKGDECADVPIDGDVGDKLGKVCAS